MKFLKSILFFVCLIMIIACAPSVPQYKLTLNLSGGGVITTYPQNTSFDEGSSVLLIAIPDVEYEFLKWSGDINSAYNPLTIKMDKDYAIEAIFAEKSKVIKYELEATWDSYNENDKLINTVASQALSKKKSWSSFKKADFFDLDANKANRERAILVKYKNRNKSVGAEQRLGEIGHKDSGLQSYVPFERIVINKDKYSEIPIILDYLNSLPEVEYAEEDGICKALSTPNDEYYSYQWNFSNLQVPAAWNITEGDENVIVAVLDTGVYFPLSDLGSTSFVQGFDFINNIPNAFDDNGHGSHVTGTIAQSTNNDIGVAGMANGIKIMPVKVLAYDGYGSWSSLAQAIYFAVNNGAHIINMSLGGSYYSNTLEEACNYAASHNVLLVAAAGNEASSSILYPANFDSVMAIGAVNDINQLAYYSNFGTGIDLVAPGGDFSRTLYNNEYETYYIAGILQQTYCEGIKDYWFFQGTSMATPHVSALAALLKSKNPNLTAKQLKDILISSADDLGAPGYDIYFGYGVINSVNALGIPGYPIEDSLTSTIWAHTGEIEKWRLSAAPCTIDVKLNFSNENGELSLELVNSSGTIVSTGTKSEDTLSLQYTVSSTNKGDYWLIVSF